MKRPFNIQELLHHKSNTHAKPTDFSSSRAFQRYQEHDLKHHNDSVNFITPKQNKLPSFIDRHVLFTWFSTIYIGIYNKSKIFNKNQWLKPSHERQKGKSKEDVQLARTKERRELVIGSYLIHRPLMSPTRKCEI